MPNHLLLTACYLPPISYFHLIQQHQMPIVVEQYEHFQKQSYRSRASIATANGVQDLIVPILHAKKDRVPIKDTRISYEFDWQRLHWLSLQAAYRNSAYFEYYEDDFAEFYKKKHEFLLDYTMEQLTMFLKMFKLKREISFTTEYFREVPEALDFRDLVHPKKVSLLENPLPYYQVFEQKNGFIPNLSAVDVLFNQGPQAKNFF